MMAFPSSSLGFARGKLVSFLPMGDILGFFVEDSIVSCWASVFKPDTTANGTQWSGRTATWLLPIPTCPSEEFYN
jgi:hypothetical protein